MFNEDYGLNKKIEPMKVETLDIWERYHPTIDIPLDTTFYTPEEIERNSINYISDEELSNYDCSALREHAYK